MSKRALILVEGQTEERFVKDVLTPHFATRQLYCSATLLVTKHVKDGSNFKGGVTNFAKFKNDVTRLLKQSGGALVTTLIDYYGLPNDFPGMNDRPTGGATGLQKVQHVEKSLHSHFGRPKNFLPFFALHEFEAWLFTSPEILPRIMTDRDKEPDFTGIASAVSTPEDINDRPEWAPSKRIQRLFPAYRKTLHGPLAAKQIGLKAIQEICPHFNTWMAALDDYSVA